MDSFAAAHFLKIIPSFVDICAEDACGAVYRDAVQGCRLDTCRSIMPTGEIPKEIFPPFFSGEWSLAARPLVDAPDISGPSNHNRILSHRRLNVLWIDTDETYDKHRKASERKVQKMIHGQEPTAN